MWSKTMPISQEPTLVVTAGWGRITVQLLEGRVASPHQHDRVPKCDDFGLTVSSRAVMVSSGSQEMTYPSPECIATHSYPGCHTPAILKHGGCCRVSVSRNVLIKDFVATNNYRCVIN